MQELLLLVKIQLRSILRKIKYDLVSEIVVLFCSVVLIGLFYYIFQDFLNDKLKSISKETQGTIAMSFSGIILFLSTILLKSSLERINPYYPSIENFAGRIGSSPKVLRYFRILRSLFAQLVVFGLQWIFITNYLYQFELLQILMIQFVCTLIISIPVSKNSTSKQDSSPYKAMELNTDRTIPILMKWRWIQITRRKRNSQISLLFALAISTCIGFGTQFNLPPGGLVLLAMLVSILSAGSLIFLLEKDVKHLWLEKSFGISHSDFTRCYLYLGLLIGGFYGLFIFVLAKFLSPSDIPTDLPTKLALISFIGPTCVAAIMFQLDASRAFLQFMSIFFISLFLGTAVFINLLFFVLLPVLIFYAMQYQNQQFYKLNNLSAKS